MTWLTHIDIQKYREDYELQSFVETGCWQGAGIRQAYDTGFHKAYSCDIKENFVEMCNTLFPYAHIEHSESLDFLTRILPTISEKTLFWLDAHFPDIYGHDDFDEKFRLPLLDEIELIKQLKPNYAQDVIICDDIRTFRSDKNPTHNFGELPDKHVMDVDWDEFVGILSDTHDYTLITEYDGVMIFYPKP
jgi:hypothetical protein